MVDDPAQRIRECIGFDGAYEWFWHRGQQSHLAPTLTVAGHLGWTAPIVWLEAVATGGAMYPLVVADGGYIPLAGGRAGGGIGLSNDGSAAPIVTGGVVAPFFEARYEATRWERGWHAPRLSFGAQLPLNCCSSYQ